MTTPLHVRGVLLPEAEERDLWVVDGRITFEAVPGAETLAAGGWVVPGLVDAHCHIGLGPGGPVHQPEELHAQGRADAAGGALLVRDAGSPADTRFLDGEADVPRIVRCGHHIARPKRYSPDTAEEVDVHELPDAVDREVARGGAGWVKLVGDWIDRGEGDLTPLWPADVPLALHDAGLPAEAALAAGSWAARRWLGHPALEEGAPADFLVCDGDPLADLGVLRSPVRIVLRGRILA